MNFKRIVSAALVCVMLAMSIVTVLPIKANAAYSSEVDQNATLPLDSVKAIVNAALLGNYASDLEMLEADMAAGYVDHVTSADGKYTIYVNRYTGVMYYKNNIVRLILEISLAARKAKNISIENIEFSKINTIEL